MHLCKSAKGRLGACFTVIILSSVSVETKTEKLNVDSDVLSRANLTCSHYHSTDFCTELEANLILLAYTNILKLGI